MKKIFIAIVLSGAIIGIAYADWRGAFDDMFFKKPTASVPVEVTNTLMTASNLPSGYLVSVSSIYADDDSTYGGWHAFDGSNSTMWHSKQQAYPIWIEYDFASGLGMIATNYTIRSRTDDPVSTPKAWDLRGWGATNWVTIDTQTNGAVWGAGEVRSYNFTNVVSYEKYRWTMVAALPGSPPYASTTEITIKGTR